MNGKHPIDDLFARSLHDAEAMPPAAVWEGIARDRDRARAARTAQAWRTRGLAAGLLLLLGGATYWLLAPFGGNDATPGTKSFQVPGLSIAADKARSDIRTDTDAPAMPQENQARPGASRATGSDQDGLAPSAATAPGAVRDKASDEGRTMHGNDSKGSNKNRSPRRTPGAIQATAMGGVAGDGKGAEDMSAYTEKPAAKENPSHEKPNERAAFAYEGADIQPSAISEEPATPENTDDGREARGLRPSMDVYLPLLTSRVSPIVSSPATAPGPILQGDPNPAYVLKKSHSWIAVQAAIWTPDAVWKGTGPEVGELNKNETWQGGQSLAVVYGREWLSGWSTGVGIGVSRQRSRFLRHETTPGHSETVIDTTWTGTAMGAQTNYTWDIVETVVNEPGVGRDYSATNMYTRLRIAPEVGYRLVDRSRFSLHALGSFAVTLDAGRKGRTLVRASASDSLDLSTNGITTLSLDEASLDERFPLSFALSASMELRYRLCERWSISGLPMFTYHLPRAETRIPGLSMTELGAAVRLRYEFRHQERRAK